ncbi:protein kinase [Sinirhodobacter sp. WL0062]|uniref:non-specific serine/threonine protein kinase n=1 Tax=Rhodobacter flavimaris TaxID=2907145 RepID=A0ABS8YWV1_9RHOB|nr:serine/threonine protein kinase [Sinirhodobacter sp. WL0062]MCE5974289.1 protein kinase [Sinirhodobacter sp. WL0062]
MNYAESLEPADDFLPVGTTLLNGTYAITDHLGSGGFGLTYLAGDQIGRKVVLKECFPASVCLRRSKQVRPQTRSHEDDFEKLIHNFVGEARQLAKLKHENVVPVLHFFEENDTAYMALEYVDGVDLTTHVDEKSGYLTPRRIMDLARQLVGALDYVHRHGVLHRDIAPDNIIVSKDDTPVLIDFGAARNVDAALAQSIFAVKDGFSPPEFYQPGETHSAASDIYSFGATLYTLVTGQVPVDAQRRMVAQQNDQADPLAPLTGAVRGFPEGFLRAIDKAMALAPADRPQRASELLELMQTTYDADGQPVNARKPHLHVVGQEANSAPAARNPTSQPRIPVPTRPAVPAGARTTERPGQACKPVTRPTGAPAQKAACAPARPVTKPATRQVERTATALYDPAPADANTRAKRAGAEVLPPLVSAGPDDISALRPKAGGKSNLGMILAAAAIAIGAAGGYYVVANKGGEPSATETVVAQPAAVAPATLEAAPVETATAAPATAPVAAPVSPAEVFAPAKAAVAAPEAGQGGWRIDVELALTQGADAAGKPAVVFTGGENSPYPAGTVLAAVGGSPVGGDPNGVAALAASYFAQSDPASAGLPVEVTNPLFGTTTEAVLPVQVSREVSMGSFDVVQEPDRDTWRVRVSAAKESSGLIEGDILLSERQSGHRIERASDLSGVLEGYSRLGQPSYELIVQRNGATKIIGVGLSTP